MKKSFLILIFFLLHQNVYSKDWATVQIFACEPEWGALAKEIVGNKAKVFVAINEFENPYFVEVKPNLISAARKADIIFCSGADLEAKWLPEILRNVSNTNTQMGSKGYFMAADYVKKLPTAFSSQAQNSDSKNLQPKNIYPTRNPHIHLNPNNIPPIATEFAKLIIDIDPANAKFYQKNYDDFIKRWNLAIVKWEFRIKDLKNMPIIVGNNHWDYLVDWIGLDVIKSLQEKPGKTPPTSQCLLRVLKELKTNPSQIVIYSAFEDKDSIFWFINRARIKAVLLPYTVSSNDSRAKNLFGLFDQIIDSLLLQVNSNLKNKTINQP